MICTPHIPFVIFYFLFSQPNVVSRKYQFSNTFFSSHAGLNQSCGNQKSIFGMIIPPTNTIMKNIHTKIFRSLSLKLSSSSSSSKGKELSISPSFCIIFLFVVIFFLIDVSSFSFIITVHHMSSFFLLLFLFCNNN